MRQEPARSIRLRAHRIDFSNASTGDTWVWDFGDGSPTVEAFEPSHSYTTPGAYTVTLIAMDSLSCNLADTIYLPITIGAQQPIDADFSWTQTIDCTQMEISTTNQSTGDPLTWYWDMGDGTQYVDTNVVHQFPGRAATWCSRSRRTPPVAVARIPCRCSWT